MEKRVLLGMSGGTDSSVAAMKLQEAGYEVTGVTLRLHDDGGRGAEEAARLADRLGIDHFEYDAREAFEAQVVRYFTEEYLAGRTPVPCTVCNNRLKWPLLARLADERGIRSIATGHYVRKVYRDGRWYIAPAADADKDQSFFLWGLKQDILERMLLPMGDLTKAEARAYAARRGGSVVSSGRGLREVAAYGRRFRCDAPLQCVCFGCVSGGCLPCRELGGRLPSAVVPRMGSQLSGRECPALLCRDGH